MHWARSDAPGDRAACADNAVPTRGDDCDCGEVTRSAEPIERPAPCVRCGGVWFRTSCASWMSWLRSTKARSPAISNSDAGGFRRCYFSFSVGFWDLPSLERSAFSPLLTSWLAVSGVSDDSEPLLIIAGCACPPSAPTGQIELIAKERVCGSS